MTDKKEKIIIDGVDVSECRYFEAFECNLSPYDNGGCRNYNCYYKKLQVKEQECKELNSDNRYFVNMITSLELLTDRYEQALNEIENYCNECNLKADYTACAILGFIEEIKEN